MTTGVHDLVAGDVIDVLTSTVTTVVLVSALSVSTITIIRRNIWNLR